MRPDWLTTSAAKLPSAALLREVAVEKFGALAERTDLAECIRSARMPADPECLKEWRRAVAEEVRHREAEHSYTASLTHGQLYILRELRILFEATPDEDIKQNANVLEKVFRGALTGAVKRELNQLRRSSVTGESLYRQLVRIYDQHNLKDASAQRSLAMAERAIPMIICSEAFV